MRESPTAKRDWRAVSKLSSAMLSSAYKKKKKKKKKKLKNENKNQEE